MAVLTVEETAAEAAMATDSVLFKATDAGMIEWLDKIPSRLQDVYWRLENEGGTVRQAIDFFMRLEEDAKMKTVPFDPKTLKRGLYRVFWKQGGESLAAVGVTFSGEKWIAPCNWAIELTCRGQSTWDMIERVELIEGIENV
jgi:hypothetical protein